MNHVSDFGQNRPVHLARRDVFYEHAVEMLSAPNEGAPPVNRIEDFEKILFVLRISHRHARFAVRTKDIHLKDHEFCKFIELLIGNIKAVLSMLKQKDSVEHAEGFFFSFLGINHASVALQAEEFERRANDVVRCVQNTLQLAEEPFLELKNAYRMSSEKAERIRYKKAHKHFTNLLSDTHILSEHTSAELLLIDPYTYR